MIVTYYTDALTALAAAEAEHESTLATLAQVRVLHEQTRADLLAMTADRDRLAARVAELEAQLHPATKFGVNLANSLTPGLVPQVARIYFKPGEFNIPRSWGGGKGAAEAYAAGTREFVISVKDSQPAQLERVAAYLATVPADVRVWGCFFHEHEGNIRDGQFTADQYRERFAAVSAVFREAGAEFGPIHNGLNRDAAGRWVWGNYVEPDPADCTFWGLDCYDPQGKGVATLFDQWLPYAQSTGLPIVVGETGTPYGPGQAAWAADMRAWCSERGVALACWWHQQFTDRPDYRMTPETQAVWLT